MQVRSSGLTFSPVPKIPSPDAFETATIIRATAVRRGRSPKLLHDARVKMQAFEISQRNFRFAERLARGLRRYRHLIVPGEGHGQALARLHVQELIDVAGPQAALGEAARNCYERNRQPNNGCGWLLRSAADTFSTASRPFS